MYDTPLFDTQIKERNFIVVTMVASKKLIEVRMRKIPSNILNLKES